MDTAWPTPTAHGHIVAHVRAKAGPPSPATTPFVKPFTCASNFRTTIYTSTLIAQSYVTVIDATISLSEATGECRGDGETWSPAVCPSGWTAYSMGVATTQENADANKSTAKCCASGFTLAESLTHPRDLAEWACVARGQGTTQLVRTQSNSVMTFAATDYDSISIHKPWTIEWARSDAASLSPSPPPLGACTSYALHTWTPGDPINTLIAEATPCPAQGSDSAYLGGILYYFVVPIPILVALIIGGCIWWCCARRSRQKREQRLAAPQRLGTGESKHAGQWRDVRAQDVELETLDGTKKQ